MIKLSVTESIKYYYDDAFKRKIHSMFGSIILDFSFCNIIKDIGNLRNIKHLMINTEIEGLHLLKELESLSIHNNCSAKTMRRLKKLSIINKIEVCKIFKKILMDGIEKYIDDAVKMDILSSTKKARREISSDDLNIIKIIVKNFEPTNSHEKEMIKIGNSIINANNNILKRKIDDV